MKVFFGLDEIDPPLKRSALTIGNYDGVHRGHRQIVSQVKLFARQTGGQAVVLTFDPHPLAVAAPSRVPAKLTPVEEKLRILEQCEADVVVVVRSTPELLELSAEGFVAEVVVKHFDPTHMVEGPSFGFGHRRRGNPELLKKLGGVHGFEVCIVEPVKVQIDAGQVEVSSTLVRRLISQGRVEQAAVALGRAYVLLGRVKRGKGRGGELGFPTINLGVQDQLVPQEGVYAGRAEVKGRRFAAAVSIGRTPTFDKERSDVAVEAHLLDADDDFYEADVRLELLKRLRDQEAFPSAQALKARIAQDVEEVRRIANSTAPSQSGSQSNAGCAHE